MARVPNSNAGKGRKYTPGETEQRFGSPHLISPGATVSREAIIRSQPHATSPRGGTPAPQDRSSKVGKRQTPPKNQPGNALPHGGGVRVTQLPPGDRGRRNMDT